MTDTTELLGLALQKNPTEFGDLFTQLIQQKQLEAIEQKRLEMAQSLYGSESEESEEPEEDFEDDIYTDDIEDFEIDLDDLGPFDTEDNLDAEDS